MQGRVDAIVERDGSVDAAVTGGGVGIGYLFARDIVRACEKGEQTITLLRGLLQDVVDVVQSDAKRISTCRGKNSSIACFSHSKPAGRARNGLIQYGAHEQAPLRQAGPHSNRGTA
jgi:hypothetical protein